MSIAPRQLIFIRIRRSVTLIAATITSVIALWTVVVDQGGFAMLAVTAAAGFIISFMIDGKLLGMDWKLKPEVRLSLVVQAVSVSVASAIIIYVWSAAVALDCLDGCNQAQVDADMARTAIVLAAVAGLLFLAPSLSVLYRGRHR
jgi:hypothetical protein